jgi:hypothetical protein
VTCGQTLTVDTTLEADLACSGDGLLAGGVTLNLNGHVIRGSGSGVGVLGGTVENGTVRGFDTGISLPTGVKNMTVTNNRGGIFITTRNCNEPEHRTRIANSIVARNTGVGIEINAGSCNVDVADSRILFNGGDGIWAYVFADGGRYTNNVIQGNGGNGLNVRQSSSTVVGNTVRDNGADGIHMSDDVVSGLSYFIADNVAVGNRGLGIWTWIYCSPGFCQPGVMTDGGGNVARKNGDPRQCVNVVCAWNEGRD